MKKLNCRKYIQGLFSLNILKFPINANLLLTTFFPHLRNFKLSINIWWHMTYLMSQKFKASVYSTKRRIDRWKNLASHFLVEMRFCALSILHLYTSRLFSSFSTIGFPVEQRCLPYRWSTWSQTVVLHTLQLHWIDRSHKIMHVSPSGHDWFPNSLSRHLVSDGKSKLAKLTLLYVYLRVRSHTESNTNLLKMNTK